MDTTDQPVIVQLLQAMEQGDVEALERLVHEDAEMVWPQSGERFVGRDNALAAMAATPVKPEPAGEPRVLGGGNLWVVLMPLRYGEEISHYAGVYEFRDGRLARSTEYFGAPFPPNEARAAFTARD